jgi:hypothetical protein
MWNLLGKNANAPQEEILRRVGRYSTLALRSTGLWNALSYTFPQPKHQPEPEQHEGD